MKLLRLLVLLVVLAATATAAQAACPPAKLVLSTIREANSAQVLRLGPRSARDLDWQSDDPDVFLGYEVLDSNPLSSAEVAVLTKVLGSPSSYDCRSELQVLTLTASAVDVGFTFHSDVAVARVVLHANESQVELEFFNGAHTRSRLSAAGHKGVERLLDAYAVRTAGSRKAWTLRMVGVQSASGPVHIPTPEEENGVDVMPEAVTRVPPQYPDRARESGIDGTVLIRAWVSASGTPDSLTILKSIPMLDDTAMAAVHQWRFRPAQKSGQPASAWVEIPIKFSLH